jgi:4-alpha-glucanotransferase
MADSILTFQPSADYDEALARAAEAWGIEAEYWDIWGQHHVPSTAARQAVLRSMGVACGSREELDSALEERLWREWTRPAPPTLVASVHRPLQVAVAVPEAFAGGALTAELVWEDGPAETLEVAVSGLPLESGAELRGQHFTRRTLALPFLPRMGYHELRLTIRAGGEELASVTRLILGPDRAWLPARLAQGGRAAGLAVSLYGLRSARNWGCGDFTDLERLVDWCAGKVGVGFVALNPLHAIANRQPYNTSPYLPESIFFRNPLYLDVERIGEFRTSRWARRLLASAGVTAEIRRLRQAEFVEYERVWRLKLLFLRVLFREFLRHWRAGSPRAQAFRAYLNQEGELLELYARYAALGEWVHRHNRDVWIWPEWPAEYQDPASPATEAFARRRWRLVLFHQYLQWQVDLQLAAVQKHALDCGMEIGLYHDVALATDACGSDLWAHRRFYVAGCRVGSPPDDFAPQGQDWAFPPPDSAAHFTDGYRHFVEQIRQNLRHGGALRLDHVMRFFRLYWIPDGMPATAGAYVRERAEDLLRILALESVRHRVIIIGEDLGTVPDYIREALARYRILSYRLLFFERKPDGEFKAPSEYPRAALVAATTHDLATLAGFWTARDVEARREAGLLPDAESYRRQFEARVWDKQKLLDAAFRLGLLPANHGRSARELPELTGELHNALIGILTSTPSMLMVLNQEDLTKETEQQNLPGSTWQYPNWRRKMRYSLEELETSPLVGDFVAMFRHWLERSGRLNPELG